MSNRDYYGGGDNHHPQQQSYSPQGYNQNPSQGYNQSPPQGYNPPQGYSQGPSHQHAHYPAQQQSYEQKSPSFSGHNNNAGYSQQAQAPNSYNHGPGYSPQTNIEPYHNHPSHVTSPSNDRHNIPPTYGSHENYSHSNSYGGVSGPSKEAGNYGPGQEGERGLGATIVGGAAGGILAHKSGAGKVAAVLGSVAGAVGANIIEHKLEKRHGRKDSYGHDSHGHARKDSHGYKDEKKHKKDKKEKKEKKHKRHGSKSRDLDSNSESGSGSGSD